MKKRKNNSKMSCIEIQNPVAKFAFQFNKAQIFCDKRKYTRKSKHGRQEIFPVVFIKRVIGKIFCLDKVSIASTIDG
ncbi:MAG: hypothetical protein HOP23_14355 [Methylococcaceae bacterium]|nr:hypothetical protein [Methylococcaceae bacterium]